jgi:hypothetical protein
MNEMNKRPSENERAFNPNSYNVNSFRVVSNAYPDKSKQEGGHKLFSPRMIFSSVEKSDKDDVKNNKQYKPKLLTGKLPSAFDMKYKG